MRWFWRCLTEPAKRRTQEGALSPFRTPVNPPAPTKLVPLTHSAPHQPPATAVLPEINLPSEDVGAQGTVHVHVYLDDQKIAEAVATAVADATARS